MQLSRGSTSFNKKYVESILKRENKYITELLDTLPLPSAPPEPGMYLFYF